VAKRTAPPHNTTIKFRDDDDCIELSPQLKTAWRELLRHAVMTDNPAHACAD
jgi:hypothetical protein